MENRITQGKPVALSRLFNPELLTQLKTGDESSLSIAQVMKEFAHIPLTEPEAAVALMDAYKLKAAKMGEEAKRLERQRRIDAARKMWTAEECYAYAYERGKIIGQQQGFDFVLDKDNEGVFELLSYYFSCDERFEQADYFGSKYSLQKGICLLSPVRGNGKTTLLDCFMWNKRNCFFKRSTKQLVKDYEKGGIESVERFLWLLPAAATAGNFYQNWYGIHYDDFADEGEVLHMGNRRQVSSMIINSIYDDHRDTPLFWCFHVSMNYMWSEYEQKYGSNTASRMEEMYNLIPVHGNTRRK